MPSFDEAWAAVAIAREGEPVSSGLRPLLQTVYQQALSERLNEAGPKSGLANLLEFLAGPGRTNANCWAADRFFCLSQGWERNWDEQDLPENLHDILAMMGEALHDTVKAPDVAKNFGCLPEQLLERLRALPPTTNE